MKVIKSVSQEGTMSNWPPEQNCLGSITPRSRRLPWPLPEHVVRCPVCNGNGAVPSGFYNQAGVFNWTVSTTNSEECRTCAGAGIVRGTG
jgi:DnaJ-class molecular chaperone